jgi:hypothetical protein
MWKLRSVGTTWIALLAITTACGGSGPGMVDPDPDPDIEAFVGRWDAEVFEITSDADTTKVARLIELGASFTLNVEPSGTYTATLDLSGVEEADSLGVDPFVEIGRMAVNGDFITLTPTTPAGPPVSGEVTFLGSDHFRLVAPTEFDFNFDSELDPAELLAVLRRH